MIDGQRVESCQDKVHGSKKGDVDMHLMESREGIIAVEAERKKKVIAVEGDFESLSGGIGRLGGPRWARDENSKWATSKPIVGLDKLPSVEKSLGPAQIMGEMEVQLSQAHRPTNKPLPLLPIHNPRSQVSEIPERSNSVRPSQLGVRTPLNGIKLMVDLSKAECRRSRRRQLSNLIQIHEEISGESEEEETESKSSTDSIESSQRIIGEVRATMAIGAELNVNFFPDDEGF